MNAVLDNNLERLNYLMRVFGVDQLNNVDENGNTPLMIATENENIDIVKSLLEKGAIVNSKNKDSFTAYDIAIMQGYTHIAEYLKQHGARSGLGHDDMPPPSSQRTVEQIDKEAKVKFLDYILQNDYDNVEAYMGYFRVYNQPVGLNFDLNTESPLAVACDSNKTLDIIKLLLDHGADPNYILKDAHSFTETAIFYAVNNVYIPYETTKYLLDHGADPNIKDDNGRTVIDFAIRLRVDSVVQLLRDYKSVKSIQRKFRDRRTKKRNRAAKRIQSRIRDRRTKKRNRAAKRIQSRTRGNISRRRLTQKKAWKGTEAFDPIMYEDEDIFEYLQSDRKNFVIQLPGSDKYETLNLNDLLKMKRLDDLYNFFRIGAYDTFYECHKYDIHDYQDGSKNVNTTEKFMKLGIASIPVLVPEWFFGNWNERFPIPEPRIFKLEKYKVVNSLVSTKLYHYLDKLDEIALHNYAVEVERAQNDGLPQEEIDMMEPDWPLVSADHCNEKKPIQIYKLVPIDESVLMVDFVDYLNEPFLEEDYVSNYLNMLKEYSAPSDSSELRRRMTQLSNPIQNVNRRLFDSDSDDYDPTYQPDRDLY